MRFLRVGSSPSRYLCDFLRHFVSSTFDGKMTLRLPHTAVAALLIAAGLILVPLHFGAQDASSKRKLVSHESPAYPPLARNMALEGVVKAEVLVSPDGSVKSVNVLGGHPVLAQAAVNTVRHWKWEPASHETHEIVQIRFARPD